MRTPHADPDPPVYRYGHKLYEPRAYAGAISRDDLLSRIFGREPARIVLVQGPAGHGKSTVLQQAMVQCRRSGMLTAWLNMDEADNDLRRLSMHLQAMLSMLEDEATDRPESTPAAEDRDDQGSRADGFIARLLEFKRPLALFFDDFQAVSNRSVLAYFKELIDHLPERVRMFFGSRSVPDIGLARQVVNHQALVLRAEELRFSPVEVRRFFAGAQDLSVREDELKAIYRKTEGWPAALQLFRLSLASPNVRGSLRDLSVYRPRELADYLADNVLALQTPQVQEFLLHSAPLRRLSGPLCDEVLERCDSQAILLQLERSGLFVRSLDAEAGWFGYHALFASFLEDQLRAQAPARLQQIHERAARWFKARGHYEEAMGHAMAAGEHALAADVLDVWASRLVALGHLVTVEHWYEALPLDEVGARPELVVKIAWALCFLRRSQKLPPIAALLKTVAPSADGEVQPDIVRAMLALLGDRLETSRDIIRTVDVQVTGLSGFRAFEIAAAANLRAYLAIFQSDFEGARQYLALARSHGEIAESGFSLGYSIALQGMSLLVQGRLADVLELYRQAALLPWMRLDDSVASAVILASYVQALYEAGDVGAAEQQFEQSHEAILQFAPLDFSALALLTMSRIHELRGRPSQAVEMLDEAEQVALASGWPRLTRMVEWERVRRWLLRGEVDRAMAAASRMASASLPLPAGWIVFSEDHEGERFARARLSIHQQQPLEALATLQPERAADPEGVWVRRQVKLNMLLALAHEFQGDTAQAQQRLAIALEKARPGGLVRCILDEGKAVVGLLERLQTQGERVGPDTLRFATRLLQLAGRERPAAQLPEFQALEPLTERERKILILLANGATNDDIAARMFVSRNTVKFHLKNIYSKLAVNSRLQATNAARAMGLVV